MQSLATLYSCQLPPSRLQWEANNLLETKYGVPQTRFRTKCSVETHYPKLQTQEIRGGLSGVGCNAIFTNYCCWSAMLREEMGEKRGRGEVTDEQV